VSSVPYSQKGIALPCYKSLLSGACQLVVKIKVEEYPNEAKSIMNGRAENHVAFIQLCLQDIFFYLRHVDVALKKILAW
jgi:hypothetical protein